MRVAALVTAVAALAVTAHVATGHRAPDVQLLRAPPSWVPAAARRTLDTAFGGARPIHTSYIAYPKKIVVIWEFDHSVTCEACPAPPDGAVGGPVIRLGLSRQPPHYWLGSLRACYGVRGCIYR